MDRDRRRNGTTPDILPMPGAYMPRDPSPSPTSAASTIRPPGTSLDVPPVSAHPDRGETSLSGDRSCGLSFSLSTGTNDSTLTRLRTPTTPILTLTSDSGYSDSPMTFLPQQSVAGWVSTHLPPPSSSYSDRTEGGEPSSAPHVLPGVGPKRRPSPLNLRKRGLAEDDAAPLTGMSAGSACSTTSAELHELRQSMQNNLRERPISMENMESGSDKGSAPPSPSALHNDFICPEETIVLASSASQHLLIDTRPLDDFLAAHLPQSAHVSIPSLIFNRLRKHLAAQRPISWASVGSFVSTPAGRQVWEGIDVESPLDIIVLGADAEDLDKPRLLIDVLTPLVQHGRVRMLKGGWRAIAEPALAAGMVVSGEADDTRKALPSAGLSTGVPYETQSAPSTMLMPPLSASAPAPSQTGIPNPSMSLSPLGRNLPSLKVDTGLRSPRPPKLCINLDRTAMSATLPKRAKPSRGARPTLATLTIDVGDSNKLGAAGGPHSAFPPEGGSGFMSARSHRSLGDQQTPLSSSLHPPQRSPWTGVSSSSAGSSTYGTPLSGPIHVGLTPSSIPPAPKSPAPLEVSTILPSFLFLGPEISTRTDVDALLSLGIRRILNVAFECDDDEGLDLKRSFERYYRIPMKDSVEASGVGQGIKEAMNILDDARLHSAPVYVHCKAGKSRSVTVVLAYLIHANAWTLKTSYAYVAERRHGISPNIGFVAELILFEEQELGRKAAVSAEKKDDIVQREARIGPRYTRESLPPEWAMSYGALVETVPEEPEGTPEARHRRPSMAAGAEIEVRKNGQWVHHRRPPVDRDTLQPGRRVSKAGLESMAIRPLRPATPQDDDRVHKSD